MSQDVLRQMDGAHEAAAFFVDNPKIEGSRSMSDVPAVGQLSDEELAAQVATGSRSSFEALVARYSSRLYYFLRPRFNADQDVEDLVQETFLKAFRNIERFDPEQKFSTWLYTIAIRQAISRFRAENKKPSSPIHPSCGPPDPQDIVIQKAESKNIWDLARKLGNTQFEALWLHYAEEMSIKEMADILKKKPITVRVLLHRARANLAEKMEKTEASDKRAETSQTSHKFSNL